MRGREVYALATRRVPEVVSEALGDAGWAAGSVARFVLHQANARMLAEIGDVKNVDAFIDKVSDAYGDGGREERRRFY